ncbi:UDP-2,3-diacylglucosamine diphosphatase LpxI [Zavarzinia compransoris]|uniref:LpxI family protein n=1 Tax=Zavarzinia marina TaxID=2911065 RepID=UPI001F4138A8|nr:UDP-2,3-diacylglucosamine diphosphatase LpxI [Zavarzinia marina]MCF4164605.1 UDP-2,3-diacylglucosamine diphosphatase LpxI [Zavarzinia marina]
MAVPDQAPSAPPKLAIVAGGGDLPVRLVEACRRQGRDFHVFGLVGSAEPRPSDGIADDWLSIGSVGLLLSRLRATGCRQVVMAGNVARPDFARLRLDWKGLRVLPRVLTAARRGDDSLLRCLVTIFEEEGFTVIGADAVLDAGHLLDEGPLGAVLMDEAATADLERAIEVVEALGRVDVGQGAVVADGNVLAVEAVEGTDRMLARVADLRAGWSRRAGLLLKLPKPQQERRVDLPVIGVATVEGVAAAGLAGIAGAAGATLVMDRQAVAARADALGVFVVGIAR